MPDKQAVVTLYPLFQPDVLPFRSLTFAPDTESVKIGRASKREAKGLVPAHHNALFESRVMSRDHAQLRVSFEKKEVYIRDNGSMHGTWVNCQKISADKDVPIHSGDVVIFGTEVIRGEDTYPPMRVRCECQWFDLEYVATCFTSSRAQDNLKTNTFCVPDDDDDEVIEIVDEAPMDSASTGSYVPDDADISSDSDHHKSAGNSTPITSPLKKDVSVELVESKSSAPASELQRHALRSQQSPVDLEEENNEHPLVTPRMTPPSVEDTYEGSYAGIVDDMGDIDYAPDNEPALTGYSRGDSATGSDGWEESEEQDESDDDLMSHSSFGVDTDGFDREADAMASNVPSTSVIYESLVAVAVSKGARSQEEDRSLPTQNDAPCSTAVTSGEHVSLQTAAPTLNSWKSTANEDSTESTPLKFGRSSIPQPVGVSNPVSRSSERSLDHSLACFHHTTSSSNADECWPNVGYHPIDPLPQSESNGNAISQDHRTSAAPYTDGPFVNSHINTAFDDFEKGIKVHSTVATDISQPSREQRPNEESVETWDDGTRVDLQSKHHLVSSMAGSEATRDSNTRLSIADIVDTSEWTATSGLKTSRKRKAPEMESDSEELDQDLAGHFPDVTSVDICDLLDNQFVSGSAESFSQDAQPQVTPVDLDASLSHLTGIHAVAKTQNPNDAPKAAKPAAKNERASKRRRVSGSGSFGSHVATALLGAMVGGLGTVALLASLPTDYFA
ncbi:FHA domain protein [Aspergillus fischeri NRRL 181]|uniref:FHA domain protein n=1 Tax=Neosartorya fischeri (strain ATCC 1020 / DSM 3700 / CBS 544.65 / FGSC A1164 / JCM 1740 / NRRL 181 / WB 181) TaxID=331117 RepID=A1CYL2_NEOFI|nr:FHA domain protein [Aspergillus fischeri NRRL 181]EAW23832.1 FHA domain protein [Aspergillus fischeri NRRL 181]